MGKGCDSAASFNYSARTQALKDNSYTFIGRYLNESSGVRDGLTSAEVTRLSNAGINIVSLYESDSGTSISHFTRANGISDAKAAIALADDLGMKANKPIYFCIDTQVKKSQMKTNIVPYVQGIISVLADTDYLLGIYGSKAVCKYIRGTYEATERYMFVCDNDWDKNLDWSSTEMTFDDWNLGQYKWNQTLPGTTVKIDVCESASVGGGGWRK